MNTTGKFSHSLDLNSQASRLWKCRYRVPPP